MKATHALVACLVLGLASASGARADELTPEKRADIEQLLEMTHAVDIGKQMGVAGAQQIANVLKQARPDIPQSVLDALPPVVESVIAANIGSFKEAVIPLYGKYFTGPEVKEMIRFYSTELGQKAIRVMPALMQESLVVGQEWGRSIAPQIDEQIRARLKTDGYDI